MRAPPLVLAALTLALFGCAPRTPPAGPVPVDLGALEARRRADPDDPRNLTEVGVAYFGAGAFAEARDVLTAALALDPGNVRATIHLGLACEKLGDPEQAVAAYRRALALPVDRAQRRSIETQLVALTSQILALEARRAIAAEQSLSARAPAPNTVAVLPWTYVGADASLKPLERGLAYLVLTDLARVSRLTLLERDRVQALATELALAGAGRVDSSTAARSGRLLGAADVVQGVIRETAPGDLRLDANVVNATNAAVRASGSASDKLSRLFAMEKVVVFELLDRWGIPITPAERREIGEQPTADLQAFLAFSRGLAAEDRADFTEAGRQFQDAAGRDPSFAAARARASSNVQAAAARSAPAPQLVAAMTQRPPSLRSAQLGAALQTIAPSLAGRMSRTRLRSSLILRSRLAEALRQDELDRLGTLASPISVIPRP